MMWSPVQTLAAPPATAPNFSTNFNTSAFSPGQGFNTGNGGCGFAQCSTGQIGNGDPTPFYQQVVSINNSLYFHVLTGDPAAGFAEESYTPFGAGNGASDGSNLFGGNNPFGAGNEMSVMAPNWTPNIQNRPSADYSLMHSVSNLGNPLDTLHISGDGGANPNHAIFRMVLTSSAGDMSLEVSKPFLDKKPVISQTVQDGTLSSQFVADMTKLGYSDSKTPAPVKINMVLNDPTIPGAGAADFTMARAQQTYVTAGRYTFTPGSGWNNSTGWDQAGSAFDLGTYNYVGGAGFNPFTMDWTTFFNYDQNALACQRPGVPTRIDDGSGGVGSCPGHP